MEDDPFFSLAGPAHWNAYVGRQGEERYYVDGYIEAALELAGAVIDKELSGQRDTLIMPILFTARHGVELSLKHALRVLQALGVVKNPPVADHDIWSQYRVLRDTPLGDVALREYVRDLAPYVASLAAIDEDGQALRYPVRRDGKKSLANRSLANIQVIRESLTVLHRLLTALRDRLLDVVDERGSGTFTSTCSRCDLWAITQMLPPRAAWNTPAFDAARSEIQAQFGIGNTQFSRALNMILGHRQMGARLGLEFPLSHLSDEHAALAIAAWMPVHPPREPSPKGIIAARRISATEIMRDMAAAESASHAILTALSGDEIADLETIYNLGRTAGWPEFYSPRLEAAKREHAVNGHLLEKVMHLVEKTNFGTALADGASILGRVRLAKDLRKMLPQD